MSPSSADRPVAGAHYRPTSAEYAAGVYRVVGTDDPAALLRLTDGEGRRAHTGELVRVPRTALATEFEAAEDPDAGIAPIRMLRNQLQALYWSVRRFV